MNVLEITVQRRREAGWPVIATHTRSGNSLPQRTDEVACFDLEALNALAWDARAYGKTLGQALFVGKIHDAFIRALNEARGEKDSTLRVLLFVEADDLKDVSWQRLHAPVDGEFTMLAGSQSTPYTLYLPSLTDRRFQPIGRRDLRALVLVAGPGDISGNYSLTPFPIEKTVESVRRALGKIECDVLATVDGAQGKPTLDELCLRITAERYTMLHIVCHGKYLPKDGETVLYMPDNEEQKRPVTATQLVDSLSKLGGARGLPHLAYINACESATLRAENGLGGLGQRLVRQLGMPAVVAMTEPVSIETAEEMAFAFYTRLRDHGEPDRALAEACAGLLDRPDLTVPALFSRLGGRPLFSDTPDRDLTVKEIEYGLESLEAYLKQRAPVLLLEFNRQAERVRRTSGVEGYQLSPVTRSEREKALAELNQLCLEVLEISFPALATDQKPPKYDDRTPFRGLYAFHQEDSEFFFGREALVEKLAAKLKGHKFLAVMGPSGSGKSSLVLAGLVPHLKAQMIYLTPNADPLAQLKAAQDKHRKEHGRSAAQSAVLVVDQFEELFTLCSDDDQRKRFIDILLEIARQQRVVATMRADFWGEVALYPALREEMTNHMELVAPMDAAELRRAMDLQAGHVGLRFEADLSQDILDDVQNEPGAMPLLQHALLLLWQRRHGRWLRTDEYRAIGGIRAAIARTADEVYDGLKDNHQRELMRDIFIRLTHLDDTSGEQRDTRQRVSLSDMVTAGKKEADVNEVVQILADARLVVTSVNAATGVDEVEVAHEALIRYWPKLRAWLDEDRASLQVRAGIRRAAGEWKAGNQEVSLLIHSGSRLSVVEDLMRTPRFSLNAQEEEYVQACVARREALRTAEERRRKQIVSLSLLAAVIMAVVACFGLYQANRANQGATAVANALVEVQNKGNTATVAQGAAVWANQTSQANEGTAVSALIKVQTEAVNAQNQAATAEAARQTSQANEAIAQTQAAIAATEGVRAAQQAGTATSALGQSDIQRANAQTQAAIAAAQATIANQQAATATRALSTAIVAQGQSQQQAATAVAAQKTSQANAAIAQTQEAQAIANANIAKAGELAAQALNNLSNNARRPELAFLMAAEAYKMANNLQTQSSLLTVVQSAMADSVSGFLSRPDSSIPALGLVLGGQAMGGISFTNQPITMVAVSPSTSILAAGRDDGSIILWDMAAREPIRAIYTPGFSNSVTYLTYLPDGSTLAVKTMDGYYRFWDTATGNMIGDPVDVNATAAYERSVMSPDGKTLIEKTGDQTVRWWFIIDQRAQSPGSEISVSAANPIYALDFYTDSGRNKTFLMVVGDNVSFKFIPPDFETPTNTAPAAYNLPAKVGYKVGAAAFSRMRNLLAVAMVPEAAGSQMDPIIRLLNAANGSQLDEFSLVDVTKIESLAFSADGMGLVAGCYDTCETPYAWLWNVSNPNAATSTGGPADLTNSVGNPFAISRDGRTMAFGFFNGFVKLVNLNHEVEISRVMGGHEGGVESVVFRPQSSILASASFDQTIRWWETSLGVQLGDPVHGHTSAVRNLSASLSAALLASAGDEIILWNTTTRAKVGQIPYTSRSTFPDVFPLALSPDGKILAAAGSRSGVNLWDVSDPGNIKLITELLSSTLPAGFENILAVAFSPDGKYLAISKRDMEFTNVSLWDVTDPKNAINIDTPVGGYKLYIQALAFSGDSRVLAYGNTEGDIYLWDVVNRRSLGQPLAGHQMAINSLAFGQGSKILASSSDDGTVRLWEIATLTQMGLPMDIGFGAQTIAFSPDGKTLAAGDSLGYLWLIATDPQGWLSLACQIASRNFTRDEWDSYLPGQTYRSTCSIWPAGQ